MSRPREEGELTVDAAREQVLEVLNQRDPDGRWRRYGPDAIDSDATKGVRVLFRQLKADNRTGRPRLVLRVTVSYPDSWTEPGTRKLRRWSSDDCRCPRVIASVAEAISLDVADHTLTELGGST